MSLKPPTRSANNEPEPEPESLKPPTIEVTAASVTVEMDEIDEEPANDGSLKPPTH